MNSKLIEILKKSPRVGLDNITNFKKPPKVAPRGKQASYLRSRNRFYSIIRPGTGFEEHVKLPWFLSIPKYGYNRDSEHKRNYVPFTLWQLQRLIDLGRIDTSKPIDLTQLVNCRGLKYDDIDDLGFGVVLTEQGSNIFQAKVNIEVQVADEVAIAAIEKHGGTVTTSYYDKIGVSILHNPVEFFLQGEPIPKRILPPRELIDYYTDPATRGYLSNPDEVNKCRQELAQKFGYILPNISEDKQFDMLTMRKDPRQLFFGLSPGWIVNLHDKNILKPCDEQVDEYLSQ